MDRLACVDVPALPLQLLLQRHPEWQGLPAAVVDEDKPQGLVLWANARAREAGVLPGLRYGPALSLAPGLRAGTISEAVIREGVQDLFERLHTYTPDVEPSAQEPGVFWLDAGGLGPVYPSLEAWALSLRQDLLGAGYVSAVVVGFRRFGTYAVARALRGRKAMVFDGPELEDQLARGVPLTLVGLPPGVREALGKLGVQRVGDLLRLPAHGIGKRFGPEALALHRFASGAGACGSYGDVPLSPTPVAVVPEAHLALDYQETNAERLVFIVKPLVDRLLHELGSRGWALTELRLTLVLDEAPELVERIRTAEATLAVGVIMELVKLRLTASPLPAPVVGLAVTAEWVTATSEQLAMFASAPRRDPAAAARAFARLRAAFGDEAVVVKAAARDRHTPEGAFAWEPLASLAPAHPRPAASGVLVRRMLTKAEPLSGPPGRGPDGWRLLGPAGEPTERWSGPYRLCGGWWRSGLQRDYYFAELRDGSLMWVYYDQLRERWFLQGEIS